jgi:hypothetical protein
MRPTAFTVLTDAGLVSIIEAARHRLVVVAPALSRAVADSVAARWRQLGAGAVVVVIDSDPEVYRLGYGEEAGLKILVSAAGEVGAEIRRQPGLRLGVLISDSDCVLYSPVPKSIEAGPNTDGAANAIRLTSPPPSIVQDLGIGMVTHEQPTVGREPLSAHAVEEISHDLAANPPRRFDVVRTERVFNAMFEFAELALENTHVERRRVQIPGEFMGFARDERTKRLLTATFRPIDDADLLSGERLQRAKDWIVRTYLTQLPGHGTVVLRTAKRDFEKHVDQLRRCVRRFQRLVERRLEAAMDKNVDALVDALLPVVLRKPPDRWRRFGPELAPERARTLLCQELRAVTGSAAQVVGRMRVKLLFKAVTYESLVDETFQKIVRERLPPLAAIHEEHEAAPEIRRR